MISKGVTYVVSNDDQTDTEAEYRIGLAQRMQLL